MTKQEKADDLAEQKADDKREQAAEDRAQAKQDAGVTPVRVDDPGAKQRAPYPVYKANPTWKPTAKELKVRSDQKSDQIVKQKADDKRDQDVEKENKK